jgi:hypothetical protein
MKTDPCRRPARVLPLWLAAALLLALALIWAGQPTPGLADAGGWPTASPSPTLTPTTTTDPYPYPPAFLISPEPTSPLLLFPPTPTYTQVVPGFAVELAVPEVQAQVATPAPPTARLTWVTCVPFALIILAIALVGTLALRSRIRQGIR